MTTHPTANFIMSQKGNRLLNHGGYIYCRERISLTRNHWRCVNYFSTRCSGRAVTVDDIIVRTTDHNHSASATEVDVRETVNEMKVMASTSNDSTGTILREVAQHVPTHIASNMPTIHNLRRIIQRQKQASNTQTNTPHTFSDIVIPHELTISFSDESFLLHDNENPQKRILIFSTPRNLVKLESSEIWMMDGTFKSTPHPFTQIYTIHAKINNSVIPLVYSLLPDKTSATYTEFLSVIKSKTHQSPRKIIIDFELSMINVISKMYTDTQIQGCFFHFSQAFWRKVQKTPLVTEYSSNSKLQVKIKKLTALCFVPPESVDEYYTAIIESEYYLRNEEILAPILNYMEDTWIGHLSRSGRRRKPRFHVEWWNCYSSCLQGEAKTNNAIEGWHNSFNHVIGKHHPNFYSFLETLKKEQSFQGMRISKTLTDPPQKRKWEGGPKRQKPAKAKRTNKNRGTASQSTPTMMDPLSSVHGDPISDLLGDPSAKANEAMWSNLGNLIASSLTPIIHRLSKIEERLTNFELKVMTDPCNVEGSLVTSNRLTANTSKELSNAVLGNPMPPNRQRPGKCHQCH
ncbi:uncharacterized protein LOC144824292 [Lissotriton helveticus]